jgi:osmotically-inducible protein OsmY
MHNVGVETVADALQLYEGHIDIEERYMKKHTSVQWLRVNKILSVIAMAALLLSHTSVGIAGSAGEFIDDSVITTKVKSSFVADSTVSALDISVETTQGVVNLTGIVNSEQERQRAIQIAQETNGVRQVDARNLVVKR